VVSLKEGEARKQINFKEENKIGGYRELVENGIFSQDI
jgi:hypothetical protein